MKIPPIVIKDYLSEKFTDFSESGREFRINSIFTDDNKQKLYINLDTGLWTCFKSGEKGNFYQLISHIENVPYLSARSYVKRLAFDAGASLFEVSSLSVENKAIEPTRSIFRDVMRDFKMVIPTKDINSDDYLMRMASKFALGRKLGGFKFYVGVQGRYHQRVIIPYFYKGEPFYFQARSLINRDPKYLNPSKNLYGIKTSEILYPFDKSKDYVMVTEGPLDAMSLRAAGFNATCTQGCKMSTAQAKELSGKKVIIAYDNDESGSEGFQEAKKRLLTQRNPHLYSLSPPKAYKDWNDFWVDVNEDTFSAYIYSHIFKADWELDVTERLA